MRGIVDKLVAFIQVRTGPLGTCLEAGCAAACRPELWRA